MIPPAKGEPQKNTESSVTQQQSPLQPRARTEPLVALFAGPQCQPLRPPQPGRCDHAPVRTGRTRSLPQFIGAQTPGTDAGHAGATARSRTSTSRSTCTRGPSPRPAICRACSITDTMPLPATSSRPMMVIP